MAKTNVKQKFKSLGLIGGQSLFALGLLLLIIAATDKSDIRFDLSLSGNYSIHPATKRIVNDLKQDVHIYGVWNNRPNNQNEAAVLRNQKNVREKIKRIAELSPRLSFTHLDPQVDLPKIKEIEEGFTKMGGSNLYIRAANNRQIVVPYGYTFDQQLENTVGSALLAVESQEEIVLSVLTGHGELQRIAQSPDDSLSQFEKLCSQNGIRCDFLDPARLSKLGRIPPDTILCIMGPTSPYGTDTIKHVQTFLQAGGNALVLADYRSPPDLCTILRWRGVVVGSGMSKPEDYFKSGVPYRKPMIVLSADQSISLNDGRYDRLNILNTEGSININPEHQSTRLTASSGRTLLFPYTSAMTPMDPQRTVGFIENFEQKMQAIGTPPYAIEPLVKIKGKIWASNIERAKIFPDKGLSEEEAPLAVAIRYALADDAIVKDKQSRTIVFASRQMASNRVLSQTKYANGQLLIDSVQWLAFRDQRSNIPAQSFTALQVNCSESTLNILGYLLMLIIPLSSLTFAILTWWDRR